MPATREQLTKNLFLLEELEHPRGANELAQRDLAALRAVADWTKSFVAKPNKDLGRPGSVCPFVHGSLERKTLWLASEQVGDGSVADVVERIKGYHRLFLDTPPTDGDDAIYRSFVVVFTDLPEDRANDFFDELLRQLAVPSYVEDGFVMGGFHEGNEGTAIYNSLFRPFTSPVPFLLVRQAVISDWKFFLDNDDWLDRWAHRYGESGVKALADELRRLPWRAGRGQSNLE
jgi:hypothetical protein